MANYTCAIRTNYFRVKDADKFKAFMSTVYSTKAEIKVFESLDKDGVTRYGFGAAAKFEAFARQTRMVSFPSMQRLSKDCRSS